MAIHCDRGGYVTQYGDGALSVMGQKVELPLEKESSYREVVFIWPSSVARYEDPSPTPVPLPGNTTDRTTNGKPHPSKPRSP
ncbi:hypothetical protein K443DRAFT_680270 [Laccaria amethystina LaAM-08-1]|uniref:Uncharacterized protein n=1 Tax=Laccaria amethystina LaAM-08-1 TaxID=1095629 RepID=A0A0C9XNC9_9AGAR|nr:hypothetical protein K443DRAFT_680270 [Laccaria amethystina LaAM-08-1]